MVDKIILELPADTVGGDIVVSTETRERAEAAAAASEAARDQAQVYAANTVELQDTVFTALIADEESATRAQLNATFVPQPDARPVIWDDDWYTDTDQTLACRVLGYYNRIGKVNVIATVVDTTDPRNLAAADGALRYEGITAPIGQIPTELSDLSTGGAYLNGLACLPHRDVSTPVSSTVIYRRALASQSDGSVDIISTGYLNAIQALLTSPADAISPLTGLQLVTAKVRHLWMMGGKWPSGSENNFTRSALAKAAAQYVVTNWPTSIPVTFLGYEIGDTVLAGASLANAPESDPVRTATLEHVGNLNGRASWDALAVMLAAIGNPTEAGYTTVRGTASVSSTGANTFTPSSGGPHEYVVKSATNSELAAMVNALMVPGEQRDDYGAPLAALYPPPPAAPPSSSKPTRIIEWWVFSGLGSDGASVPFVPSYNGGIDLAQPLTARQPVYWAAVTDSGGVTRPCMRVAGGAWIKTYGNLLLPNDGELTAYFVVRWSTVPTSIQTLFSLDRGMYQPSGQSQVRSVRGIHVGANASGAAAGADFNYGTDGASVSGPALTANKWHLLTFRRDRFGMQVLLDGVAGAISTAATKYLLRPTPAFFGGSLIRNGVVAGETVNVDIAEARIYDGCHTDTTVAAIKSGWV